MKKLLKAQSICDIESNNLKLLIMPTTRPSRSTKSVSAAPKRASASTGAFRQPPSYDIGSLDQASSGGSLAIQPSHGLPAVQKRKATSGLSGGKQEEAPIPAFHIRPVGDAYEQQAYRIAEKITGQLRSGGNVKRISEPVKPLRENGGKKEGQPVSQELASSIASVRGKGRPLPAAIRRPAEKALGRSLSDVRLHTGARASALNREVGSSAFAVQKDIFAGNQLDFTRPESQAITLHELVHTQQQQRPGGNSSNSIQTMKLFRRGGGGSNTPNWQYNPLYQPPAPAPAATPAIANPLTGGGTYGSVAAAGRGRGVAGTNYGSVAGQGAGMAGGGQYGSLVRLPGPPTAGGVYPLRRG